MSGGADILILLTREDVNANQVYLHDKRRHTHNIMNNEGMARLIDGDIRWKV